MFGVGSDAKRDITVDTFEAAGSSTRDAVAELEQLARDPGLASPFAAVG